MHKFHMNFEEFIMNFRRSLFVVCSRGLTRIHFFMNFIVLLLTSQQNARKNAFESNPWLKVRALQFQCKNCSDFMFKFANQALKN